MFIFISYSSKDRALVDELADDLDLLLSHDHLIIWYDRELNRSGGHQWWDLILESIRRCDVFINALSVHVLASEPCRREYQYARDLKKPILPLLLSDLDIRDLPIELQAVQLVRYQQRSRDQQKSLNISIRNLPPAPPLPDPLPIAPDAPLDPVGIMRSRIANLTSDSEQQRRLIRDIEDMGEEKGFAQSVRDLLLRLIERDDVLTARNLRRAQDVLSRLPDPPAGSSAVAVSAPAAPSTPSRPTLESLLPAPFAMVPIPAGKVRLVTLDGWADNYVPKGKNGTVFDVPAFKIARYPVTNAQFRKFVDAKGYDNQSWWTSDGWKAHVAEGWTQPRYWEDAQYEPFNRPDHPVVGVSWFEAVAFCRWSSAVTGGKIMLPTEQMWQRAAQGDTTWAYPWGDRWDGTRCQNSVSPMSSKHTSPVTQYAGKSSEPGKGDSPLGVSNMAGNIWEWCLTEYETGKQNENESAISRVLRGGSWRNYDAVNFRADYRNGNAPDDRGNLRGFRISLL